MKIIPNIKTSPIILNKLLERFYNKQRTSPIIPNVRVNPIINART